MRMEFHRVVIIYDGGGQTIVEFHDELEFIASVEDFEHAGFVFEVVQ